MKFLSVLFLLLLAFTSTPFYGQSLSERIFLTEKGISDADSRLKEGYRAFTFDADEFTEEHIRLFRSFLEKPASSQVLVFFVKGDYDLFVDKIGESGLSPFVEKESGMLSKSIEGNRLLVFTSGNTSSLFAAEDWINTTFYKGDSLHGGERCRLFTFVDILQDRETAGITKSVFRALLQEEGKLPNFIRTGNPALWQPYIDSISKLSFNHADVRLGDSRLEGVTWKELPETQSCGPVITTSEKLSPKKRGFWFSPDIFSFSGSARGSIKIFQAYPYDIKEGLRYYLPLQEKTANTVFPYDNGTYTDVKLREDPERGRVAYFNGKTSYIDFRDARDTDFNEITVSAWIKPDKITGSLSLIGKGEAFSAKIFNGKLQFTTPGLKDHYSEGTLLKAGSWIHLTYVYSLDKKVYFYVNGKLVDETVASALEQTRHSILIGSNLWGQYYEGMLSEFCVWNRALSDSEVRDVYSSGVIPVSQASVMPYVAAGVLFVIILCGLFYYQKKRKKSPAVNVAKEKEIIPLNVEKIRKGRIQLLDEFKLIGSSGEDITFRLSPKRKELLLLLILYTLKEGGVSSRKMGNLLWPGFSSESVKNNRSTHIKEIRNIFENELDVHIVYANKMWRLETGNNVEIDIWKIDRRIPVFSEHKEIMPGKEDILKWADMVSRGPILPQTELEWIDAFKSDYANTVLDVLVPCMENPDRFTDEEELRIIRAILTTDPLYEPAVRQKVSILVRGGKHTLAKKVIDNYRKLYENFYGEMYKPDFPVQL
ncbi:LamG domain-containing protein [Sinomicrobium sp. M5D2P17]